ncbi:MAG: hypothetical protein L0Y62_06950, partial [Nitrospirae bacterium]|nr:hypothetical protein [Nitrospirota bacterium]
AGDITLIEMVSAYTGFAAGSVVEPVSYEKVLSRNGAFIEDVKPYFRQVLSPKSVQEIRSLLRAVVESGTAQAARKLKRAVYGKTGTTNDFTDAWFIGFDDRLAVGVWVGRDDHKPLGTKESGSMAALPIWIEFMEGVQVQTD